ncbi:MAG: AmmeMemoRadiSam system radical SAM enzyme [Caldiserica bacterium]|nr:MAG: AmmeMemoRadiSam system radical SAM enzyme [Caldisericota bacterium]
MRIERRKFIKDTLLFGISIFLLPEFLRAKKKKVSGDKGFIIKKEAYFYEKLDEETVRCLLCHNRCILRNGVRGFCRVREPEDGKLYTLVYGNPTAIHVDPIEKKPFFHFLPGTGAFSIATAGCNYRCKNCQNWQISQFPPEETVNWYLPPIEVVKKAIEYKCPSIAYTYTEPLIFYEYTYDSSVIAKKKGIKNVLKTNGAINREPMEELCEVIDGANVDLKFIDEKIHYKITKGDLKTVLDGLLILKKKNVWIEITNLIIPTLNDKDIQIRKLVKWIKENLGREVPIHFSRFYPHYLLKNLPPTPKKTLIRAREIALSEGMKFVYVGNLPGNVGENTYCPKCGKIIIKRIGFMVLENKLKKGNCPYCGTKIPGVWN